MSDPQPAPGRKTPPRAEPLQPDQPASGNAAPDGGGTSDADAGADDAEAQKKQSETAIDNVREGYR